MELNTVSKYTNSILVLSLSLEVCFEAQISFIIARVMVMDFKGRIHNFKCPVQLGTSEL